MTECDRTKPGDPLDFAIIFTKSRAELTRGVLADGESAVAGRDVVGELAEEEFWRGTDLDENLVRGIGLDAGLVDVKVCAGTEVWSGLKFVRRLKEFERNNGSGFNFAAG